MSEYVKSSNFTAKDSLPSGNSGKIIKGTEIDTEFTAIASAISSKADINSPTFTGTPAAPTAISTTNTTQVATTAFVQAVVTALDLDTMSTQASGAVAITGGSITGITDLAVADGGTGASTLTANAVLIGNGTSAITAVSPGTSGNVLKSDGTNWTSTAAPETGVGIGQTWQNMTGSRSFGSSYTNSTSKPIMVAITSTSGSGTTMAATVGGVLVQTNGVHAATELNTLTFIVPPSTSYSVASTETLNNWAELR